MKKIAKNKKAYFNYEIIEEIEVGIVLEGNEVKSLRNSACSLNESYAKIDRSGFEIFVINMTIDNYKYSSTTDYNPKRKRKLLLHKREIIRLLRKTEEKNLTMVPLNIFFNNRNIAKITLGIVRGKKQYDKREQIKRRDFEREQGRTAKYSH